MKAPTILLAAIETAINRYLELDPPTLRRLAGLNGRVIAIDLRGLDLVFYLLPATDGMQVLGSYEGEPDTRLRGTPLALMRMGVGRDAPGVLFSGDVEISGDTDLGRDFKQILDGMDVDWEEHLSHITGDVAAHQLGRAARGAWTWGSKATESLGLDLAEYLQEESRLVAAPAEVEQFVADVDVLRSDADRLEARVRRLREAAAVSDGKSGA